MPGCCTRILALTRRTPPQSDVTAPTHEMRRAGSPPWTIRLFLLKETIAPVLSVRSSQFGGDSFSSHEGVRTERGARSAKPVAPAPPLRYTDVDSGGVRILCGRRHSPKP